MYFRYTLVSILVGLFGLWALSVAGFEETGRGFAAIGFGAWPKAALTPAGQFGFAIGGATMAGWAAMIYLLARSTVEHELVARVVRTSAQVWFVLDSMASVVMGAYGNLVVNLTFIVVVFWATSAPDESPATEELRAQ